MSLQIQLRRDVAANWTSVNPILSSGEIGYETDTVKYKIGDGVTAWNSLTYFSSTAGYATENYVDTISGSLSSEIDSDISIHSSSADHDGRYYRTNFETITLSGTDISNKYVDLEVASKINSSLVLSVYNGTDGIIDIDFTVSGTRIHWSGKEWDGILEADDVIKVMCYY